MNQHGETFEERPPAGEYWLCPLVRQQDGKRCAYKLLVQVSLWGPDSIMSEFSSPSVEFYGTERFTEAIREKLQAHTREREARMMEHLKTHQLIDFYRTRAEIIGDAHRRADEITSLADRVFLSTATQEQPEGGE